VIAGSRSFAAMGQWAADAGPEVLTVLGAARGAAEESTFCVRSPWSARRCSTGFSAPGCTPGQCRPGPAGPRHRRQDRPRRQGKDREGPHLVAALAHGIGAILGQAAVEEKSNEIPAMRDLLKAFASLAAAVITTGAMHTQHDTAQVILGRGADYVMTVKANIPILYRQLKKLPWAAVPSASSVSTGHGRRSRRTIKAVLAPTWIEFAGAPRSRSCAARSSRRARRRSRSCTSSPATATPARPPWPPGSAALGR
jgi:hypothetical protein